MIKKKIVILTGAGISAESGIQTFRDAGGLWEGHDVMEVASPAGWEKDPEMVLDFYNQRRRALLKAKPNEGHTALVELEDEFDVTIVTQNVDDLHERAGSKNVVHLHGELFKVRSTGDPSLIYERTEDLYLDDYCEKGFQLRPHIVWFGEMVPMMDVAVNLTGEAEVFVVIGTSLAVYPAAGLIHFVAIDVPKFLIDPNEPTVSGVPNLKFIQAKATIGVPQLVGELLSS